MTLTSYKLIGSTDNLSRPRKAKLRSPLQLPALAPLLTTQVVMLGQQYTTGSIPAEAEEVETSLGYIASSRPV